MESTLIKNNKLLVLTPIPETFGEKEKIIFLGAWCNAYSKKIFFKNRDYIFLRHPYNINKKKFLRDQKYLEILRGRLLSTLTVKLNSIHKIRYSKKEWNFIIGRWISIYTSVLFDRWEILRFFFLKKKFRNAKVYFIDSENKNLFSTLNFVENCLYSDIWNHQLFKEIINFKYKKNLQIKVIKNFHKDEILIPQSKIDLNFYFFIKKIVNYILILFAKFILNFNKFIIDGIISKNIYLKLCYKLKTFPFDVNFFFNINNFNIVSDNKKKILFDKFKFFPQNNFEKFLIKNVKNYFPQIFLQNFSSLRSSVIKFTSNKKIIFSQIAFLFNDIYNIWLVEMLKKKSVFIPGHHGGSFIVQNARIYSRKDLSKDYIVWHKPVDKTDVQLTPLSLLGKNSGLNKNRENCLIITHELPRYYYMLADIPVVENNISEFLKIVKLIKNLKKEVFESIIFRNSQNVDWGYKNMIKKNFKNKIKFSSNKNIYSDFSNTRLSICAYPSTPFSESINLNIPSIFFFTKKNWNIHSNFRGLLDDMQNENLFFYDAKLASKHINQIWHNVDSWWNKSSVQKVVNQCKKDFFKINKDWLNEYNNFFNKFI